MDNSNLLKNFERDMLVKRYAHSTIENYLSQIASFLKYFADKDSPKHISADDIKRYLITFSQNNSQRHAHSALKLFYTLMVKQPRKFAYIKYARKEKRLPHVIDKKHLIDCISKIKNLKHKAILSLAFSTGMRVSEVCNLRVKDLDSSRMLITIRQAKGKKDRIVPMSEGVLRLLRQYFRRYRPNNFLFNGQFCDQYSHTSCNALVKRYIGKEYHFHTLRHSCFTALLESGTDLRLIQKIAGHSCSKTTEIYTHVSKQLLNSVSLPL